MPNTSRVLLTVLAILGLALAGCRGGIKKQPPVHPVLDMDFQEKIKPQMAFPFPGWADGRGMRMPVTGTVAQGSLDESDLSRADIVDNPLPADDAVVRRGMERFDIFCSVCHSRSGDLKGIVLQRANEGAFNPIVPQLSRDSRIRGLTDGQLFKVITEGLNTMPAYGPQIPVRDRWAIVHYLRVLQSRFE